MRKELDKIMAIHKNLVSYLLICKMTNKSKKRKESQGQIRRKFDKDTEHSQATKPAMNNTCSSAVCKSTTPIAQSMLSLQAIHDNTTGMLASDVRSGGQQALFIQLSLQLRVLPLPHQRVWDPKRFVIYNGWVKLIISPGECLLS